MSRDNLDDRLKRFRRLLGNPKPPNSDPTPISRGQKLARLLKGSLISDRSGDYCLVRSIYEFGYQLGDQILEKPLPKAAVRSSSYSAADCEGTAFLRNLLFFDTETTGLGGVGAVPFLIGFGSLKPGGFEVRQYLLPDYSDEAAMLEATLTEFSDNRTLVSYNGAAFDVNLVRDRMIVNRVGRKVPFAEHFDLLHSTRRLFRRRLGDCSLTNVERRLFSFERQDDIPGCLIPSVYFDWLQTDDTSQLSSVMEHNCLDILSLYFLLLTIENVFSSEGESLEDARDIYSLSRVFGRRREIDKVVGNFERLLPKSEKDIDDEMMFYHSMAYKRSNDWDRAVELWEKLEVKQSRSGYSAAVELAKYYEHRERDFLRALRYTVRASRIGPPGPSHEKELTKRLSRLQAKK